jgi:hypothetical protein
MTSQQLKLTVFFISIVLLAGSELFGAEKNARKALFEATRNLVKMSRDSGYHAEIFVVGGLTESGDHRVNRPNISLRCSADVRGPLMHLPEFFAYIRGDKGAIEAEGNWKNIRSTRKGRAIQGLVDVPTEILIDSLKKGSRVEWKEAGKVIQVTLAPRRSRALFSEMNNSGCMRLSDLLYTRTEQRIDGSNSHGVVEVTLDESGSLPQSIEFRLLVAFRNDQGRSAKGMLAFENGVRHVAFRCVYRLDTTVAVGQMRLSRDLVKLLK